jgi:single-stranded-DNA-specific exonuclease
MQKRWTIIKAEETKIDQLFKELKIHRSVCEILVQRGISSFEEAKDFFRPQLHQLHSPWLMKDMHAAVDRILKAIEKKEKILVFGDYDVDGTTSVASMFQFIQKITLPELVEFYIPHRYREGYGVSKMGIDYAREHQFSLIISLDCGIKSTELIQYAKEQGIDFIVCDHHLPDEQLPPAVAILNPKQSDCNYPYKELCGCGVGYKLITALTEKLELPAESATIYLDLVATAIAADIVPITGENRILAYYGLNKANENPCNGIKALKFLSGHQNKLYITNLVFLIAPRVNAAGRMDDARKAVQMFIAPSYNEALNYAEMLHSDNDERKEADSSITEEALAIINASDELKNKKTTVLYKPHWHKGVVGIVASRLTEHYYRPTIVLTTSGDYAAGSARSVNGFNLYEAIHACREYLLGYGGHFAAAGLTLLPENIQPFTDAFEKVVASQIPPELLIPEIKIDAELSFKDITPAFYKIIEQMEPFGPENMRPVFITRNVTDTGYSKIVKEQHLRLVVKENNEVLTGIFFRAAHYFPIVQQGAFDIVYTIDENEWNGSVSLQLKVVDIRASAV